MKIVLVHGFNVRDGGSRSIDRLAPILESEGHQVDIDEADYGWYGLLSVRFRRKPAVRRIQKALLDADAVITHSNGAHFTNRALRKMEKSGEWVTPIQVIHISPALNRSTRLPSNISRCLILFTGNDFWTRIAGFIPFSKWGSMGTYGPKSDDVRYEAEGYTEEIGDHSGWFRGLHAGMTAMICLKWLNGKGNGKEEKSHNSGDQLSPDL